MRGGVVSIGLREVSEVDRTNVNRTNDDRTVSPRTTDESAFDLGNQHPELRTFRPSVRWNPENFAREQIRGLVRRIFFSSTAPARHVVFSAVDAETDVRRICRRVGEALALEIAGSVAVAGEFPRVYDAVVRPDGAAEPGKNAESLRQTATRLRNNLWLVPFDRGGKECFTNESLHSHLCRLRREFEYSIVEAAPAGISNEAAAMAQLADGIILVLSAHRTRRATATSVKDGLEASHTNILGTVLADRMFPIPETIYRRL
jgi:hypothetical protein